MISDEHLSALQFLFREWREDRWRKCLDGNNRLQPEKEARVVGMLYEGIRFQEMCRRGIHKGTAVMVLGRLLAFLNEHPQFTRPFCACGKALWHKGICPVWDTYHADAIKRGHETQRRLYEERMSSGFFQMVQGAADIASRKVHLCECGCGQETEQTLHDDPSRGMKAGDFNRFVHGHYWNMRTRKRIEGDPSYKPQYEARKARDLIKLEMAQFIREHKGMSRSNVLAHFRGRGHSMNALSRMLNDELSFLYDFEGENLFPPEVDSSKSDAFFHASAAAYHIAAITHENKQYRTHHPCQSDW